MKMSDEELCCGCAALDGEAEYNMGLHVGAIFILFFVSLAGTLLPIISSKVPFLSAHSIIIEWLMAFGFGVVIATGFIHVTNDGIEMLSNPCLGSIVDKYESLGLAIVLATIILMHWIECESVVFFAKNGNHGHSHGHSLAHGSALDASDSPVVISTPTENESPYTQKTKSAGAMDKSTKRKLAVLLFEMGVIFHSVIIGVDLGVTSGSAFKTLLAAMCFHQFFEGIAIGGSALGVMESIKQVMLMNFGFAVTTPLGVFIGIALRTTYSDTSVTALWVEGVLNCVAGGILLYTGLVELMTYQMTTNEEFLSRPGKQRFVLYVAFWLGAGLMALIGKWA